MKIATFNANSVRARLETIADWLKSERPDVLCLQETKVQDPDFPAAPFRALGYESVFRGEKSYNGIALLCLRKPDSVTFGFDDGGQPDETRFVAARLGNVHILNTYVPQGRELSHPMYRYKITWFARIRQYCQTHLSPRMHVLWTGDLNVAPEPTDVHDPETHADHVCFHSDVRKAFRRALEWGFTDVLRKHHPEPGQYTFFDYRTPNAVRRKLGWRIDHLLATAPLADRSTDAHIDLAPRLTKRPSDHAFLVGTFR
jgi:exodeoxyribonuclease-3